MFKLCLLSMVTIVALYAQTITVTPMAVAVGGVVTVTVAGGPGDTNSWIAAYPSGNVAVGMFGDWLYISGTQSPATTPLTGATVKFTMSKVGSFQFAFHAHDGYTPIAISGNVQVSAVSALSITTSALTSGSVGVASSQTMVASGGVLPYSWSISSSLPAGMVFSTSGILSGTPTTAGTTSLNMQVADSAGGIASKVLSKVVSSTVSFPVSQSPGPNMIPATDNAGVLNVPAGISTGSPKTCATVGPAVFPAIKVISDGVPGAVNCGCPSGGGTTGALAFAKLNGQWSCPLLP